MSHTQVQWARGSTSQVASYTGPQGELVLNTDDWSLQSQDGLTPGGWVIRPRLNVRTVTGTGAQSVNLTDDLIVWAPTTPTTTTFTLPSSPRIGEIHGFQYQASSGSFALTIAAPSGQTINGAASVSTAIANSTLRVAYEGSNQWVTLAPPANLIQGLTGLATASPTAHGVLIGEASAAPNAVTLSAGQIVVGQASGDPAAQTMGGDASLAASGSLTVTKTNGTAFGTFATQNCASPPAIGGTTPNAGAFTTLSATGTISCGEAVASGAAIDQSGGSRLANPYSGGLGSAAILGNVNSITWIFISDVGGGDAAIYYLNGGSCVMVAGGAGGVFVAPTTTPATDRVSIDWNGSGFSLYSNNSGVSHFSLPNIKG